MENKRIFQVAKEFHVSSVALISMLNELNFNVKSHMSVVTESMFNAIRKKFKKQMDEALKDIQKKSKISEAIDKKSTIEEEKAKPEKQKIKKKRYKKVIVSNEEEVAPVIKIGKKTKLKKVHVSEKKQPRSRVRKRHKKIDIFQLKLDWIIYPDLFL